MDIVWIRSPIFVARELLHTVSRGGRRIYPLEKVLGFLLLWSHYLPWPEGLSRNRSEKDKRNQRDKNHIVVSMRNAKRRSIDVEVCKRERAVGDLQKTVRLEFLLTLLLLLLLRCILSIYLFILFEFAPKRLFRTVDSSTAVFMHLMLCIAIYNCGQCGLADWCVISFV